MIPGMPNVRDYNHPDFWEDGWILDNPLTGEKRPINKIRPRIAPMTRDIRQLANIPALSFLLEEIRRESDHARKIRHKKKQRELAEAGRLVRDLYFSEMDNSLTDPCAPLAMVHTALPSTADIPYNEHVREFINKALQAWQSGPYNARTGQRITAINEGNSSMYDGDAVRTALDEIKREKARREADEIVRRVADWGSDDFADGTVFRFRKTFTTRGESGTYTYAALRYTDHCGNVKWALTTGSVQGGGKSWDDFVFWMVTDGAPVSFDDVEVWPPIVFAETRNLVLADQIS